MEVPERTCRACQQVIGWYTGIHCAVVDCKVMFCSNICGRKIGWECDGCENVHCGIKHERDPHFQCQDCLVRFCCESCADGHEEHCKGYLARDPDAMPIFPGVPEENKAPARPSLDLTLASLHEQHPKALAVMQYLPRLWVPCRIPIPGAHPHDSDKDYCQHVFRAVQCIQECQLLFGSLTTAFYPHRSMWKARKAHGDSKEPTRHIRVDELGIDLANVIEAIDHIVQEEQSHPFIHQLLDSVPSYSPLSRVRRVLSSSTVVQDFLGLRKLLASAMQREEKVKTAEKAGKEKTHPVNESQSDVSDARAEADEPEARETDKEADDKQRSGRKRGSQASEAMVTKRKNKKGKKEIHK